MAKPQIKAQRKVRADVDKPPSTMSAGAKPAGVKKSSSANNSPSNEELPPSEPVAAPKVLAIPELREAILIELPEQDLLLAQRISKDFQATITSSIHIQRKLFFKVDDDETGTTEPKLNPLIDKMFPKGCWRKYLDAMYIYKCGSQGGPFFLHLPKIVMAKAEPNSGRLYENASWRRMWATSVVMDVHPMSKHWAVHGEDMPAAKMGEVMEMLCDGAEISEDGPSWIMGGNLADDL